MRLVSVGSQHVTQGEVRADISVEHEEGLRAPSQDLVPEMIETTSCAQGGKFLQIPVPRDPRASSVRSEETDTMGLGELIPPVPRICLPKAHRETMYLVFQECPNKNLPAREGNFWQILTESTSENSDRKQRHLGHHSPTTMQHMRTNT